MHRIAKDLPVSVAAAIGRDEPPMYQQLYRRIREGIVAGEMRAGQRLPSIRVLAAQMGIARNTVLLAYEQLLAEGCVESRQGSGHFVADVVPTDQAVRVSEDNPERTVSQRRVYRDFEFLHPQFRTAIPVRPFRANLPSLDPEHLKAWTRLHIKVLRDAGRTNTQARLMGETDAIGELRLRQAIADHISLSRGVRCSADQVIITAGAQHAMDILMRVLARPGDQAWIEDPCFLGSLAALQSAGVSLVPVPVDSEGLDVAEARRRAPDASLAIVCPSKQYPLGHVMSMQRRLAVIEWANQTGAWILEDDYDSEYRFVGKPIPSLQGLDGGNRVIYVGTFSKVLFPALRIGFIVPPPELVDPIVAVRAISGRHGSAIEQQVLARFITEGHLGRHIRRMRRLYRTRMEALLHHSKRELDGLLRVEAADSGLQTIGWLNEDVDDEVFYRAASNRGIELANLSRYCIESRRPPGVVMGFGAFSEEQIAHSVRETAALFGEDGKPLP
ncbi:MocR-like pyridoxine biosynthesis transcription factor PdxR [Oceanibacterium hippocampi]|uniref:HTH-type transcriptional regulatory protein GabR n=1 Tax=Oceanibacterium hippocampi TaxID=745714 RepID=A0A1Y5TLF3_9PROT|nr:PLP-dependent aminotransferase family protein [Oceanibacterium hippocampi]SLN66726.1 HTH-type transcriptional regulatory protein GabR [Oceanibacterium hippocampi]